MEKEDALSKIRAEFAGKQYDDQTLEYINNFIEEFDSLFGKYLSREEVIRRISENLDNVTFNYEFEKVGVQGTFSKGDKQICISKKLDNIEAIKATFFHEMIHCLTVNRKMDAVGYEKTLTCQEFEEDSEKIVVGRGFTEGITAYITKQRNKKYAPNLQSVSYPILSEQVENLAGLIGEDALMNMTFNAPEQLSYQLGIDEYDTDDFLEAFDFVWEEEKRMYISQQDKFAQTLKRMFGERDSSKMIWAKERIVGVYQQQLLSRPITTVEDFNQMYSEIAKYEQQLEKEPDIVMSPQLVSKIQNVMRNTGVNMADLMDKLDEAPAMIWQRTQISRMFETASNEEKIECLTSSRFQEAVYDACADDTLDGFRARLINDWMKISDDEVSAKLYVMLKNGLAQKIKDKKYNIDRIAVENIKILGHQQNIFNLYYTGKDSSDYLGTYSLTDELDLIEFSKNIPEEVRQSILQEHPEFAEGTLLYAQNGEIVSYNGDEKYTRIDEYGEEHTSDGESEYFESELERAQAKLKRWMPRLKAGAPRCLCKLQIDIAKRIDEILSETPQKDLRQEVVRLTGAITQQEIDEISKYISQDIDLDKKRQEALKTGLSIED